MRHRKKFNHLGRKSNHRKAMLSNMANSLIIHKRITTTVAKAKALRVFIEPLITKAKEDTTHSRRVVFSYLQNKEAVAELFRDVAQKIGDRPGGYTRILKTGTRLGDNADMCFIELVDYNENMLPSTEAGKTKTTRRSRRSGKKTGVEKTAHEQSPQTDESTEPVEATEKPADESTESVEAAEKPADESTESVESSVDEPDKKNKE